MSRGWAAGGRVEAGQRVVIGTETWVCTRAGVTDDMLPTYEDATRGQLFRTSLVSGTAFFQRIRPRPPERTDWQSSRLYTAGTIAWANEVPWMATSTGSSGGVEPSWDPATPRYPHHDGLLIWAQPWTARCRYRTGDVVAVEGGSGVVLYTCTLAGISGAVSLSNAKRLPNPSADGSCAWTT